jgi:HAD superfamily hydrolase (TIGR01509 family)
MQPAHIIFDCDGVLVDSEPLSMRIDCQILREAGVPMDEAEAHRRFVGKTFAAMIAEVARQYGAVFPEDVSAAKDRRLLALYQSDLRPVAGVAATLQAIGGAPSVASNSPADRVREALRLTALTPYFADRIVTFEHVKRGKPEPDVFIEAARRAAADPSTCLVIEDSITGVTAAARAGCKVLGFTGTHPHADAHGHALAAAGAAAVFGDMLALPALLAELS